MQLMVTKKVTSKCSLRYVAFLLQLFHSTRIYLQGFFKICFLMQSQFCGKHNILLTILFKQQRNKKVCMFQTNCSQQWLFLKFKIFHWLMPHTHKIKNKKSVTGLINKSLTTLQPIIFSKKRVFRIGRKESIK